MQELPTPTQMVQHLDRYVHGQFKAKRAVAKAVYNHYLFLRRREEDSAVAQPPPQHVLLIGPTGSGKTYLVKTLAKYLDVPILIVNAASITASGYVGESLSDIIVKLHALCGHSKEKVERAIIFFDEFDKLAKQNTNYADVRGEMVQHEFLALLDGQRFTKHRDNDNQPFVDIDTSKILMICCGAFDGLEKIVEKRVGKSRLGFGGGEASALSGSEIINQAIATEDLVKFGFIPELLGRFGGCVALDQLKSSDLVQIMLKVENSVLKQNQELFDLHGIRLDYESEAIEEIALEAIKTGTGARALNRIVGTTLEEVDWKLNELWDEGVTRVVVTKECVARRELPKCLKEGERPTDIQAHKLRRLSKADLVPYGEKTRESAADSSAHFASLPLPMKDYSTGERRLPAGITDTSGYSDRELRLLLDGVKARLDWDNTTGSARKWWEAFEQENAGRVTLIVRLAEELKVRNSTISEFFLAYVYSNTDNIQANLHFHDFRLLAGNHKKGYRIDVAEIKHAMESRPSIDWRAARAELAYDYASAEASIWWQHVERFYQDEPERFAALSECMIKVRASVEEFFSAAAFSSCAHPEIVFVYLQFMKLAQNEAAKKQRCSGADIALGTFDQTDGKRRDLVRHMRSHILKQIGAVLPFDPEPIAAEPYDFETEVEQWCWVLENFRCEKSEVAALFAVRRLKSALLKALGGNHSPDLSEVSYRIAKSCNYKPNELTLMKEFHSILDIKATPGRMETVCSKHVRLLDELEKKLAAMKKGDADGE